MNTSTARESFDDLEGMLRLAVEQIASAPPPADVAERVLGRAAKWEDKSKRQDPHPGPLPRGEGVRRRLYLVAGAALAIVVLVAVAIAIVGGLPKEKTIAVPPKVKETKPENNTEPKNKTEPQENSPNAAFGNSPAVGLGGVASPPADTSPDMRLGMQPGTGFGGSGGFGAGGGVPSKRGGASVAKEEQPDKTDQERAVGGWAIVNEESKRTGEMWVIYEDRILMYANFSGMQAVWHYHHLDASKDPKQIDITVTKVNGSPSSPIGIIKGIYALDGDELRLCLAEMGKDRPAKFPEKPGPGEFLILHRGRLGAEQPKAKEAQQKEAKQEPSVKEKPAAEKPAEKPAAKPAKPAVTTVTVQGKVVDDATGKPVDRFFTQGGKFDPADPTKVTWGTWELRTRGPSDWFQTEIRWGEGMTARIVADGYLPEPVLTSAPQGDKKIVEMTLRLKRGRKLRGVVLDHAGKPLKDAAVFPIGQAVVTMAGGEVLTPDGAKPARTDEQGRFELAAGDAKSLAVSHPQLDAWPAIIPESGEVTVRLPQPARIEINLDIDGADKESNIYYELIVSQMPEFRALVQGGVLRCDRYVKIANPGKLVLAGLTPGKYQLSRRPGRMLENQMFEVKSGEVKTIDYIRKTGARVRGKVTSPAGAKPSGITVTVTGEPVQKSPWSDHQWATVYAALTPAEDGTFLTERIPPGTYEIAAYAYAPLTKGEPLLSGFGGLSVPSFYAAVTIKVPGEGEVKVEDLALKSSKAGK